METKKTDLAVLGGGPGGYVGAIRAAKLGLDVIVVEKEHLGGTCLNWGCIPTKALFHVAETLEHINKASVFGIETSEPKLDFSKVMARKDNVVNIQRQGLGFHFKKNKIELVEGEGKLVSKNSIKVQAKDKEVLIEAKNIMLSTGASASSVPPFELDGEGIIDNIGILSLKEVPKSLLIVGGGVVGSEFANIFASFGSKVTIVEILPRILSTEDEEVSEIIAKVFKKKGIEVLTEVSVEKVEKAGGNYTCTLKDGRELTAEKILISVGRRPNSKDIGLEEAGVETDERGFVKVDQYLKTNVDNIYSVGDVIGGLQLAHVASEEGKIAVENMTGKTKKMDYKVVPWAVFTSPEIGTVGMSQAQAKEKGHNVCFGLFPFSNSGKAYITGETEGFIKIITDKDTGEILGARMIGPRASDLVHEVAVAMHGELVVDDLATTIHSHPTLSESVMEAAEDCFGLATHKS